MYIDGQNGIDDRFCPGLVFSVHTNVHACPIKIHLHIISELSAKDVACVLNTCVYVYVALELLRHERFLMSVFLHTVNA